MSKTIFSILLLIFQFHIPIVTSFYHTVPQGSVALYFSWGKLQDTVSTAGGPHFYNPLWTTYIEERIAIQDDRIENTVCVSQDHQKVIFPLVVVHNKAPKDHIYKIIKEYYQPGTNYDEILIRRPLRELIKQRCTQYTGEQLRSTEYATFDTDIKNHLINQQKARDELNGQDSGLEILEVTVEVPKLDSKVEANYQRIAEENTATKAAIAEQKKREKQRETENLLLQMDAEKDANIQVTNNRKAVEKAESDSKQSKINADSKAEQDRIAADARSYVLHKEAESNKLLFTQEYLQLKQLESYGCQNTIHYGELPSFLPSNAIAATPTFN